MPGGLIDLIVVFLLQNSFKTGLSFIDFFMAAIPINTQIPLFVPRNLLSQNCLLEMWLKMTVIYLMSLHLGVLYLHLSKLSLYYGLFGNFLMLLWAPRLSFHSHNLQGQLRSVGTGRPPAPWYLLSPNGSGHGPAALKDAEHIPFCCYVLLQCTYTQKKSSFIHLQAFHLLPRPTPAFTPQLNHQHFLFKINFTNSSSLSHDPCLCQPFHLVPFWLSSPIKRPLLMHIHWPKNEVVNK